MSEQDPSLLGGNAQPSVMYMTRAEIEEAVALEGGADYYLDYIAKNRPEHEERFKDLVRHTNEILTVFGIDARSWAERYVSSETIGYDTERRATKDNALYAQNQGKSLADYIFDWGLDNLKFEDGPDGEAHIEITLQLTESMEASFIASGEFWTDYTFRNPENGEVLHSGMHESQIEALQQAEVELELLESEARWQLECTVDFHRPKNSI
jgi:hypothetical protein